MIKRCPECNRTYSDESISFCLADGTLLSAPYDTIRDEPPPTEVLPAAAAVPPVEPRVVPPTEPAKQAVPTMTGLGGQNYASLEGDKAGSGRKSHGAFILVGLALLFIAVIVGAILTIPRIFNRQTETVATSSPDPLMAQNTSSPIDNSQAPSNSTTTTSTPTNANRPVNAHQAGTQNASSPQPETKVTLSPAPPAPMRADSGSDPSANNPTSETKQPEQTDYSRVFAQREVDTKAQLVARPKPSYTDEARQNNVQGTVVLRVVLSADGSVGNVSPIRGLPSGLTERAIAAARQIKFVPAKKDGRAVSVAVTIEYNFSVY